MPYIDLVSLTFLISLSVLGLFQGFLKDLFSILSWVGSILIGWYLSPLLFLSVSSFVSNPQAIKVVSFVLIFILFFILIRILGKLLSSFMSAVGLGIFDRILGVIFGAIKSVAIIFIVIILIEPLITGKLWWIDSFTEQYYTSIKSFLDSYLADWDKYLNVLGNKEGDPRLPSV